MKKIEEQINGSTNKQVNNSTQEFNTY